jgi:hypothetical protein
MSAALLAQTAQKLSILAEAAPSETLGVLDLGIEGEGHGPDESAGALLRRGLASLGAGSLAGETLQAFALRTPRGTPHAYVQPFDGRVALPGEHHVVLPFPCPAPAAYVDGMLGGGWRSSDPALEAALERHPSADLILRASWDWKVGAGKVKRDWLAQIRPTADGQTHLVVKGTGEGGVAMDTRPVGFATLTGLALSLAQKPVPAPQGPPGAQDFARPVASTTIFSAMLQGPGAAGFWEAAVAPRADLRGRDLGPSIHQLLAPHARGKLLVHPVPPKKEANARAGAMPPAARHLPVVAVLDLTMMGSASDAWVLTPTHAFFRDGDARVHFDWAEVRAVAPVAGPGAGEVRLRLAERGWLTLRCGDHAQALAALFEQLAQLPPATG